MTLLVEETAAAINLNQINYAVMMITPDDIEDFVIGFLFSEHIIRHNYDVQDIEVQPHDLGLNINVTLANRCQERFNQQKRQLKGTSGCGICGASALEFAFPELKPLTPGPQYQLKNPENLKKVLAAHQIKAAQTGAIHAAFWLDEYNQVIVCREDIGRHNALDKVIGAIKRGTSTKSQIILANQALLVTSRCSAELIQKVVNIGVKTLISLASPSQLAVKMANQYGLTLIHIPRQQAPVYFLPTKDKSNLNLAACHPKHRSIFSNVPE